MTPWSAGSANKQAIAERWSVAEPGGARARPEEINAYIDQYRSLYGGEPTCKVLQVPRQRTGATPRDAAIQNYAANEPRRTNDS